MEGEELQQAKLERRSGSDPRTVDIGDMLEHAFNCRYGN
jgi:hypothetical protein